MSGHAKGVAEPTRRKTGEAIGTHGKLVYTMLICSSCGSQQREPLAVRESFAMQIRATSCNGCGRLGKMKQKGVAA